MARTPKDIETELKALKDKAKALKTKKATQLGDLVYAAGASQLDPVVLAGALLAIVKEDNPQIVEGWRRHGQAFFQDRRKPRKAVSPPGDGSGDAKSAADDSSR